MEFTIKFDEEEALKIKNKAGEKGISEEDFIKECVSWWFQANA